MRWELKRKLFDQAWLVSTRPYLKGCCDHNASLVVWGILGRGLGAILILDIVLNLL